MTAHGSKDSKILPAEYNVPQPPLIHEPAQLIANSWLSRFFLNLSYKYGTDGQELATQLTPLTINSESATLITEFDAQQDAAKDITEDKEVEFIYHLESVPKEQFQEKSKFQEKEFSVFFIHLFRVAFVYFHFYTKLARKKVLFIFC